MRKRDSKWRLFHPQLFQLLRFGITGASAAIVHFVVVVILVESLHQHPLTANIYGFLSAFSISFCGHRYWTFSQASCGMQSSLPRFFLVAAFNFIGNQILYYLLLTKLHMPYMLALILVLGIMGAVTFCLSKWWAFR